MQFFSWWIHWKLFPHFLSVYMPNWHWVGPVYCPTKLGGAIRMLSVPPSVHLGFPPIIWKSNHSINFKFGVGISWVSVQNWFVLADVGPILALKWPKINWKWVKLLVSDHYHNPVQSCGVHLLGESSEFIRFWATMTKFWPSSGHKMTENHGFWPLSEKVFKQSNSDLVCTLIGWVFRIDLLLAKVGQILAL